METKKIRVVDGEPLENGDILFLTEYAFDAAETLINYFMGKGYKRSDISIDLISGAIYDVNLTEQSKC